MSTTYNVSTQDAEAQVQMLQTTYHEEIMKTYSMSSEEALVYLMTTVLYTVGAYEEAQQELVGSLMSTLSDVENKLSDMQNCFNNEQVYNQQYNDAVSKQDYSTAMQIQQEEGDNVTQAINDAVSIMNELNTVPPNSNPYSSISDSIGSDLQAIFGPDNSFYTVTPGGQYQANYNDVSSIVNYWNAAWTNSNKSTDAEGNTSYNENENLQPITDAFSAALNSVDGLNSSEGSQLQYWQGQSQQTYSLIESMQQAFMQLLTTIITSFKST